MAAIVYHYSPAGTVDATTGIRREFAVDDWMPVRRPAPGGHAGGAGHG